MTFKKLHLAALCALTIPVSAGSAPDAAPGDWPQWRGPDRSGVSQETGLLKKWPANGPERVWLFEDAGWGYSAPAIANGKLYTMGARERTEFLLCLDANTGKKIWSTDIGPLFEESRGDGPRGTPTVDGDRVYALGAQGHLICVNGADGKPLWKRTMQEFGGRIQAWGYAESVLVDGRQVVCTPGGFQGAILALDKMTGEPIWQTRDITDNAHYASMIAVDHNGKRQYIQLMGSAVVGLDSENGAVLWKSPWPGRTAVVPTPIFHDGHVYVTSGYRVGCKLIKLDSGHRVADVYKNNLTENHHGGVLLFDGHIYGHSESNGWVCQDFKTGELVWSERRALGKGAVTSAEGMLYCLDESSGAVVLAEASPRGWKEHGRFTLQPQSKNRKSQGRIWTHPVIAGGKLYLRDQEYIYCYDIKER
jgi:outer membrane protein assembly factor BamB